MLSRLDVRRVRKDTPALNSSLRSIYFDASTAPLMPQCVYDTLYRQHQLESTLGAQGAATKMAGGLAEAHGAVARLLGCQAEEVRFVASRENLLQALCFTLGLKSGDGVVVPDDLVTPLQVGCHQAGVALAVLPVTAAGRLDHDAFAALVTPQTRLVVIPHRLNGLLVDLAAVIELARASNTVVAVDVSGTVGLVPVNAAALNADLVFGVGNVYLRAPRGAAFVYTQQSWQERVMQGSSEQVTWGDLISELQAPGLKLALAAAASYTYQLGIEAIYQRVQNMTQAVREQLSSAPSIALAEHVSPGWVLFRSNQLSCNELRDELMAANIYVAGPYKVGEHRYLCISLHCYNTDEEIRTLGSELRQIVLEDDLADWIEVGSSDLRASTTHAAHVGTRSAPVTRRSAASANKAARPALPAVRQDPVATPAEDVMQSYTTTFFDADDEPDELHFHSADESGDDEVDRNSMTLNFHHTDSGLLTLDNASPPSRGLGDLLQRRQDSAPMTPMAPFGRHARRPPAASPTVTAPSSARQVVRQMAAAASSAKSQMDLPPWLN